MENTKKLTAQYIDTCSVDYLTDHCNGDNETLLYAPLDDQTQLEAAYDLWISLYDENVPEHITDDRIKSILYAAIDGVNFTYIEDQDDIYVFVRLSW